MQKYSGYFSPNIFFIIGEGMIPKLMKRYHPYFVWPCIIKKYGK